MNLRAILPSFLSCFLILSILPLAQVCGQGQYAGSFKSMIGKSFKDSHEIPQLKDYDYREGSLVSALNDPESITVDVYQKGNVSVIVFFSIMEDTTTHKYQVMDVLEVKNVPVGWEVRTTFCRYQKVASVDIVALAKSATATYLKEVRQAWRFSRTKRKFAVINATLVDCYQES